MCIYALWKLGLDSKQSKNNDALYMYPAALHEYVRMLTVEQLCPAEPRQKSLRVWHVWENWLMAKHIKNRIDCADRAAPH